MRWLVAAALAGCASHPVCKPPRPLAELNSAGEDRTPWLSRDELEIFFSSDRAGTADLYRATRAHAGDAFSAPELVAELSTSDADYDPFLSDDALTIWFWRASTGIFSAHRSDRSSPFDAPQP